MLLTQPALHVVCFQIVLKNKECLPPLHLVRWLPCRFRTEIYVGCIRHAHAPLRIDKRAPTIGADDVASTRRRAAVPAEAYWSR